MGTRHLIKVIVDGKTKVAQYGQWDGYPTGQGRTIAEFIQNKLNLRKFKKHLNRIEWITDEEYEQRWVEAGADPDSDGVTFDIGDNFKILYPFLSRDCGGDILELIQDESYTYGEHEWIKKNGKTAYKYNEYKVDGIQVDKLYDQSEFMDDGLFCEYAYIINVDKKKIAVYAGGKRPVKTYSFKDFTVEAMEKLEKKLRG